MYLTAHQKKRVKCRKKEQPHTISYKPLRSGNFLPPTSHPPMATLSASSSSIPLSVLCSSRGSSSQPKPPRVAASFGEVVRKDVEFLKKRIGGGLQWANRAFRIPQLPDSLDRLLWLRIAEDPAADSLPPPSWPQPSYPGLCWIPFISLFGCLLCLFWP